MNKPWRVHPNLKDRFHPAAPDDLQVIVHDGGPRLSRRTPEAVWVTVTSCDGEVFSGRVLNQPTQLESVRQGDQIRFLAAGGGALLMVTDKYLAERTGWSIDPCQRCGCGELFDAPSDLIKATFPGTPEGAEMEFFTAFCGLCGGVQGVKAKGFVEETEPSRRSWWRFWKR